MAIDTKQKRMNMLSVSSPLAWQHHFEVDGSVDADDRGHLLHLYAGNVLDDPSAPTFIPAFAGSVNTLLGGGI